MGGKVIEIPDKLFYKIGEVCQYTDTQPYVLRFWESEFPLLAPDKNRSGQRIYSRQDIDMVLRIKALLYDEEYTIAGARKRLEQELKIGPGKATEAERADEEAPRATKGKGGRGRRRRRAAEDEPAVRKERAGFESEPSAEVEIDRLKRRLADMEERWRRAEKALKETERARAEYQERCERVAAKLESLLQGRASSDTVEDE